MNKYSYFFFSKSLKEIPWKVTCCKDGGHDCLPRSLFVSHVQRPDWQLQGGLWQKTRHQASREVTHATWISGRAVGQQDSLLLSRPSLPSSKPTNQCIFHWENCQTDTVGTAFPFQRNRSVCKISTTASFLLLTRHYLPLLRDKRD